MAMGREGNRQDDLMVTWAEMPRSPGHVFYDRLEEVLIAGGFELFVETACQPYYAPKMGAPSVPPGRYFRMHMVGYFEGIASERGIAWRCSDSMSLRDFLRLENREKVPDHSWLSKTRGRLPHEIHEKVFGWVLQLVDQQDRSRGQDREAEGRSYTSGLQARARGRSRYRHHRRGGTASRRSRRHNDDRGHVDDGGEEPGTSQCRTDNGQAKRTGRRQGISLARPVEDPCWRRVEHAYR